MEYVASFFTIIFVALIIGTALAFGFVILIWAIGIAVGLGLFFYLREWYRRWSFLHNARRKPVKKITVIEAEFEDITDPE